MSVTWTRIKSIPFLYGGCGGQGVQPLGNCSLLAIVEETNGPDGMNVLRPFVSEDDGATWEEETAHLTLGGLAQSRIRMTGSQIVLGGVTGPQFTSDYEMYGSVSLRTMNGGRDWRSVMTPDDFATIFDPGNDFWEIQDFVVADSPKVFALGVLTSFGVTKSYLTSLDGGITFNNPRSIAGAPNGVSSGAYLGNDIVLFCGTTNPAQVQRSVDGGDTWAAVTLPGAGSTALRAVVPVGPLTDGHVLAIGTRAGVTVAFLSTDFGQTWTQSSISVTAQGAMDAVAPSSLYTVAGFNVNSAQVTAGKRPFILSGDGGATFTDVGTYATPLNNALGYVVQQLTVADDGAIIAMVQTTDVTNTTPNEIWRGVIDGFDGAGPGVALNRRVNNRAILVWDQATGQYGPAVQWVGPRHVLSPPWELDDPQPAEPERANLFNTDLEVVGLLNVQLEALQQARQDLSQAQAALVVASDAATAMNDLIGDGVMVGLLTGAEPPPDDEISALASVFRVFGEEMLVAAEAATGAIADTVGLAEDTNFALNDAIATTEGKVELARHGGRVHIVGTPGQSQAPLQIEQGYEAGDLAGNDLSLRLYIMLPDAADYLYKTGTIRDGIDRPSVINYPDLPGTRPPAPTLWEWFKGLFYDPEPTINDRPKSPGLSVPVKGDVPELLDNSIRNVSDAMNEAGEFALRAWDAVSRVADAVEQDTNEASADATGGCAT